MIKIIIFVGLLSLGTLLGACSFVSVPASPTAAPATAAPTSPGSTATAPPVLPTPPQPISTPSPSTATTIPPTATPTVVRTEARVERVLSGDTAEVLLGNKRAVVQYLGIKAPSASDGPKDVVASALKRNRELVEGKQVVLERDATEENNQGQLVRYVWVGDQLINATLVREGYARFAASQSDRRYDGLLAFLEDEARRSGLGLWAQAGQTGRGTPTATATAAASMTPSASVTATVTATPTVAGTPEAPIFAVKGMRYSLSPDHARLVVDLDRLVQELPAQYKIDQQDKIISIFVSRTIGTAPPLNPDDDIVKGVTIVPAGTGRIEIRIELNVYATWQYYFVREPDRLVFDLTPIQ